jgi:hypothetical protein
MKKYYGLLILSLLFHTSCASVPVHERPEIRDFPSFRRAEWIVKDINDADPYHFWYPIFRSHASCWRSKFTILDFIDRMGKEYRQFYNENFCYCVKFYSQSTPNRILWRIYVFDTLPYKVVKGVPLYRNFEIPRYFLIVDLGIIYLYKRAEDDFDVNHFRRIISRDMDSRGFPILWNCPLPGMPGK